MRQRAALRGLLNPRGRCGHRQAEGISPGETSLRRLATVPERPRLAQQWLGERGPHQDGHLDRKRSRKRMSDGRLKVVLRAGRLALTAQPPVVAMALAFDPAGGGVPSAGLRSVRTHSADCGARRDSLDWPGTRLAAGAWMSDVVGRRVFWWKQGENVPAGSHPQAGVMA